MQRMNLDVESSASRQAPSPHSLVLFAGFGLRPDRELLDTLAKAGVRGLWLGAAAQAMSASAHAHFDAAVLQVDEPMASVARRFEGWRRCLRCPLLVVANGGDEVDEIIALELGADGYLAGPVPPRRLRAHLLMLLRRGQGLDGEAALPPDLQPLQAGDWSLDRVRNRLIRGGTVVELTEVQAALMQALIEDQGRVVPRARLLQAVSRGRELHARSVDVYVARLRCRLRDERVDGLQIEGVRGRGYMLTPGAAAQRDSTAAAAGLLRWIAPVAAVEAAAAG